MKKYLIILLLCCAAKGALTQQFRWGLASDFSSDIFRTVCPIGDAATQYFMLNGVRIPNTGTNLLPVNNYLAEPANVGGVFQMGRGAYTSGSTVFGANNSDRSWTRNSTLRITMNGSGQSVAWRLRINMENLVQPHNNASQMVTGSGRPSGIENLLFNRQLDEWWIRGRAGIFTAWVGNAEAGSGTTSAGRFQDFSDWTRGVKIDGFGIMIPTDINNPATVNDGSNHNSFTNMWRLSSHPGNPQTGVHDTVTPVVFIITTRLADIFPFPLIIDLGLDSGLNSGLGGPSGINPRNAFTANGAVRISGQSVADNLFNFDVVYQFRGFDSNTLDNVIMDDDGNPLPGFNNQPDGHGEFVHTIGAYVHFFSPLPDFGLSLGYSALFRTFEDNANTWTDGAWRTVKTTSPLFHGMDVRMRYTGVQDLRITLNNNVSFARAKPGTWTGGTESSAYESVRSMGLAGVNPMVTTYDLQESQAWFGVYNALLVRYILTSLFTVSLEVASRFGLTSEKWDYRVEDPLDVIEYKRSRHDVLASLYTTFRFNPRITMETGLSMRILNHTWERDFRSIAPAQTALNDTSPGAHNGRHSWDSGFIGISMPVRLRVSF